ncbi:MAG: elongation factor Ts, partial [Alphaproteobacteria bacterium]
KVAKVIEAAAEEFGAPVALAGFVRFALGEGIEREEKDFAREVAERRGG